MSRTFQHALPAGGRIENYEIIRVLGQGGFGITYLARDTELQTEVAIKEYFPVEIATRNQDDSSVMPHDSAAGDYEFGLERFLEEARTLARFKEPNIVRVLRFFRANGTGYIVMDYEEGETFSDFLKRHPEPDEAQLSAIFIPILDGLRAIHAQDYLHRDIKPGNIYLRSNGTPMLIDFGASRQALGEHSRSMTGIITPGYAPFEQYSTRSKHLPCSDIYALGATIYKAITGHAPPEAPERIQALHNNEPDPMLPAVELAGNRFSERFLRTVDWMLAPVAKNRPQNVQEVIDCLLGKHEPPGEDDATRLMPDSPSVGDGHPTRILHGQEANNGRLTPPIPRTRKGLWIVLIVLALLAGGGGAAWLLMPAHGAVSVVSDPEGAEWLLDGKSMGKTPGSAEDVKVGRHIVVVRKPGYHSWQKIITVEKGHLLPLQAKLKQITYRLTINRQPRYARVKFVDKPYRYKNGMSLPAGRYRIRVSWPRHESVTREINLDRDLAIDVTLRQLPQPLRITTRPPGARIVFSDGKPFRQGMKLKKGDYRLRISAPGYVSRELHVRMAGFPRYMTVTLVRKTPPASRLSAAELYRRGKSAYQRRRYREALDWLVKAARKRHADAYAMLGRMLIRGTGISRDYRRAYRLLRQGATLGSAEANYLLGYLYQTGKGVRRDYFRALSYYRTAAAKRYVPAYNQIGWFYQKGLGVPRNYYAAARWYRRAAAAGDSVSMHNLGFLYYYGRGVTQSYASAKYWFEKAARKGLDVSMERLGDMYRYGYGVTRSRVLAIFWYRRAARKGLASARKKLRQMGVSY